MLSKSPLHHTAAAADATCAAAAALLSIIQFRKLTEDSRLFNDCLVCFRMIDFTAVKHTEPVPLCEPRHVMLRFDGLSLTQLLPHSLSSLMCVLSEHTHFAKPVHALTALQQFAAANNFLGPSHCLNKTHESAAFSLPCLAPPPSLPHHASHPPPLLHPHPYLGQRERHTRTGAAVLHTGLPPLGHSLPRHPHTLCSRRNSSSCRTSHHASCVVGWGALRERWVM